MAISLPKNTIVGTNSKKTPNLNKRQMHLVVAVHML